MLLPYNYKKAMRVLDHAIEHLGPTNPCFLMIQDGQMHNVPSSDSNADSARAVLAQAMCTLVREQSAQPAA